MDMHRVFAAVSASGLLVAATTFASPAAADRSAITTSGQAGELTVVVHGVTDYCSSNAHTDVVRRGDTIRIVRDRPTVVSRCMTQRDMTFVLHDVPPGTYTISYEQIPLIAPARFLRLATLIVNIPAA